MTTNGGARNPQGQEAGRGQAPFLHRDLRVCVAAARWAAGILPGPTKTGDRPAAGRYIDNGGDACCDDVVYGCIETVVGSLVKPSTTEPNANTPDPDCTVIFA